MQGEAPTAMRVATTCRNDGKAIESTKTQYNKKKYIKKKSDFILNLRYVVMYVYEYIIKILLL